MTLRDILKNIKKVKISKSAHPVVRTVVSELIEFLSPGTEVLSGDPVGMESEPFTLCIVVAPQEITQKKAKISSSSGKEWVYLSCEENGSAWLASSKTYFLYASFSYLVEELLDKNFDQVKHWTKELSFSMEKSTFDLFLTQYARSVRDFFPERYIRQYARLGFTHIEVNALGSLSPYEKSVPGEFYADFYTYCPGLDQFVTSHLNEGLYPQDYLAANLQLLKKNAREAVKYGLVPGLLCFEPRSVPESFFERYPTLRGARVDHPFRSFKPRYNLSVAHPAVQEHYAELMDKLMTEIPELGFITIWSNDSGAGFEHTKSLYVGRNGGAYLIREWKSDEKIAETAASNIIRFFKVLRDAASRTNPEFRVITRLEPFYGERNYLWPELADRIDVEAHSLLTEGWESNYPHPVYGDVKVLGSALHNSLRKEEEKPVQDLHMRGSCSFFYHSLACHANHEPLLGIPFPWLAYDKLLALYSCNISALSHIGGLQPPEKVPYPVNQDLFRYFQFDPGLDVDQTVRKIAESYTGGGDAEGLVQGWRWIDRAVRSFVPLSIYTHYGTVWQRLLVRPLVPDIDGIPEIQREYYEKHMCTSLHNPNRVNLAQDVLFELISKEYAKKSFLRIDKKVWDPLGQAIDLFQNSMAASKKDPDKPGLPVFQDQWFRARALRCLFETLRNTAVWIYAVHEYLETSDAGLKKNCRKLLDEMMEREIENAKEMIELWRESPVEWIIISGSVETPFIHGDNFGDLLERKIDLMQMHKNDEPRVDPDFMFRLPSLRSK
ncbi:MAG: hypothetical protein PVI66_16680 [Candidatus Aminicenantes bacterium]|jgi:hypothetical protein